MSKPILLPLALCLVLSLVSHAADKLPNILWITSEDNSNHWLGCYGNEEAKTPRLDRLAAEGNLFLHAYSNAPVCAVARSTILNGVYAPSQGTQHMRSRHTIPKDYRPYVSYLREAGYYCTNRSKTDYNFKGNDKAIWDECSGKAHYRKRKEGQPFFAIFNFTTTHESSLFPRKNEGGSSRIKPADVELPDYVPDLPEVRSDWSRYHERMTQMDSQVGQLLDELEKEGLAEDTIVFYYSDHGGPTPRGKRYLKETGVNVPMIVRVPEKFRKLSPFKPGEKVAETVAFVDLAPTLMSLIGKEKPAQMQGRAFLGDKRVEPAADAGVFLYADRFDELYGMRRGWTDGHFKYIRRFRPELPAAPYSYYQFSMPSWVAWRKAWQEGKLDEVHRRMWESPQPVEEFFDLEKDPWEVNNLANDPAQAERMAAMKAKLKAKMKEIRDTGIVPEPMFASLVGDKTIVDVVRAPSFDYDKILDLAFLATAGDESNVDRLKTAVASKDPVERYWGLLGLRILKRTDGVEPALGDEHSVNRVMAAEAFYVSGKEDKAVPVLVGELDKDLDEYSVQNVINSLTQLDALDRVPKEWVNKTLKNPKAGGYVKRFAERLKSGK
ncbi:sulfatase [Haloferula helveola]|uniref:Sulfatase n=2 Tax=Haloferula helveola TaxID=490095 RepID=A0ABN6H1G1_9BACT|nr:sulfatase [Haloferula helveola]